MRRRVTATGTALDLFEAECNRLRVELEAALRMNVQLNAEIKDLIEQREAERSLRVGRAGPDALET